MDKNKSPSCKCKKCGNIFMANEAIIVPTTVMGMSVNRKGCPSCTGEYIPLFVDKKLDKYLYINNDTRLFY